jgi:hypothetical protein
MKTTENYKELIIKSKEEECPDGYWRVRVPAYVTEESLKAKLEMAAKYSTITDCDTEEEYDEHFEEMFNFREQTNGEETFNYYIEKVCGWKIEPLEFDFTYEW